MAVGKLVYYTYYDHIVRSAYCPKLVVENWLSCDQRIVFCAPSQVDQLSGIDADVVDIGVSINRPGDIPVAFNKGMDYCFNVAGAGTVVHTLGDQYLTRAGDDFISKSETYGYLPCMFNQLYAEQWVHPYTLTICTSDKRVRFDERGDGQAVTVQDLPELSNRLDLLLDIGYLGTPQYLGKMMNHSLVWPDKYKPMWLSVWKGDKEAAIKLAYVMLAKSKSTNNLKFVNYEIYKPVIDKLGQQDDYSMCAKILLAG